MKNKKNIIIISITIVILVIGSFIIYKILTPKEELLSTKNIDSSVNTDDGDSQIDWSKYEVYDISLDNNLTIAKEGVYNLSGTINDGSITINTSGNVRLNLNNVSITNKNGPAIIIEEADNTLIYLLTDTVNNLVDGVNYEGLDEDVDGTIYSKDDLLFDGNGTLNIKANYQDGIVSKDDLKIINGTFNIEANDDGIRGKDSVYIIDGTFNINAKGDGIKSTNNEDPEKGFILIDKGSININSSLDGIQAETKLLINEGTFNITTGGGSINTSTSGNGIWQNYNTDTSSAKGLKAKDNIIITGGAFTLDTSDDSVHSNNYLGIENGTFTIISGDDGIHADTQIIIDNGEININKSYEGIESSKITINDGTITLSSTDDGINVAGGSDSSSLNRNGSNNYNTTNNTLTINGGTISVNSEGDGIDVNGSSYIYGGKIFVDGPTISANGAIDYDQEFIVNNTEFIAVGSSGMAQSISNNSTSYNALINFSSSYPANSSIDIIDENNNSIISYTSKKAFSSITVSSPKFIQNKTYSIIINGSPTETFTTTSITTIVGSNSVMGRGPRR